MLASYLLDATRSAHPLEDTALEHLGYKALTEEDVCGRGAKALALRRTCRRTRVLDYAGERADLALQLADAARADARQPSGSTGVYRDLELPLVPVLADIERAGVKLDGAVLGRAVASASSASWRRAARRSSSWPASRSTSTRRSSSSEILFDKLQAARARSAPGRRGVASTAVEVLEELALAHELPRLILEWRALQKLKGTYIDALPQLVNPETGRVHTCFNQAVAATGRLSSSDPNLQNIPIRTELGREIRARVRRRAGPRAHLGRLLADRAARARAPVGRRRAHRRVPARRGHPRPDGAARCSAPSSGLDPHELRRRAKIINYALLYGKTAFTLAKDIGVTQQAAQEFIDAYFAGFPGVRAFIDRPLAEARETGVVKTLFGRRRLVPELTSRNGQVRAAAERVAVNMPIQGTAADILKRAMIDVHAGARDAAGAGSRARMILTVHDELLFEAPESEADDDGRRSCGRGWKARRTLAVPLTVDVGIGPNWKEAKG